MNTPDIVDLQESVRILEDELHTAQHLTALALLKIAAQHTLMMQMVDDIRTTSRVKQETIQKIMELISA